MVEKLFAWLCYVLVAHITTIPRSYRVSTKKRSEKCSTEKGQPHQPKPVAVEAFALNRTRPQCGDFRGSPFALRRLLECKADITGHLQSCHLSKPAGNVEEHDLILMRAGKSNFSTHQHEFMWICPNHRYNLGRNWHPLKHDNILTIPEQGKNWRTKMWSIFSFQKKYQTIFGITIPIGLGERVSFNNYKCQHRVKYKWGMEKPYFKKQFCRVSVLLTWQVHETDWETIDFRTRAVWS